MRGCLLCGEPSRVVPCPRCVGAMVPAASEPPPEGLDWCRAVVLHEGTGRQAVVALKFAGGRALVPWMADALITASGIAPGPDRQPLPWVVTWVPASPGNERRRGFDQGRLLARAVARRLGRPCRRLLTRAPGPPQTGLDAAARAAGPSLAAPRPCPPAVLLVDDVWTTGASLGAAATALREAGTLIVGGATVGRALLKPPLSASEGPFDDASPTRFPRPRSAAHGARPTAGAP